MEPFLPLIPLIIAMLVLVAGSGFFSASEAALFYLSPSDLKAMESGSAGERTALELLEQPDRLLTAILFWNLLINIAYFSLASVCSIRLESAGSGGRTMAILFAVGALITLIFSSEMIPKSFAVIAPRSISRWFSLPLKYAVACVSPMMPILTFVNLISTRLIWPNFQPETAIQLDDLERAIVLSGGDEALIAQEQAVLKNIVLLSEIRIDEWMRPRNKLQIFSPPVSLADLAGNEPAGGYLLISEADSDEIEKALRLDNQIDLPRESLEKWAQPVLYLPWCATVAMALEKMSHRDREVTVVINEYGETIGILTIEDILETIFTYRPSRTQRLLNSEAIRELEPGQLLVMGMTNLRFLARRLKLELPETNSVTVAGVVHEVLQRIAEKDDECQWGPLHFRIVDSPRRGDIVAQVTVFPAGEESQ